MKGPKHLTIVFKIGTTSIVDEKTHEPILPILALIVDTAIKLKRDGHRVVLVSSGAIGVGLQRMNIHRKPKLLPQKQALAAIGQCRLMSIWDSLFAHMNQPVAQILLTRNDIADRSQYLNAQNTLNEVLAYGVIPIVNENDTLAVSEIKFGDNDTLSAITAAMVHADYLFLMTDVEALYDNNPRINPNAQPIRTVKDIEALDVNVSTKGSDLGTGGMATKITAARLATSAGVTTIITKSSKPGNITDIINYFHPAETISGSHSDISTTSNTPEPPLHTRFLPSANPIRNRAFWILHGLVPRGTIYIDPGAASALKNRAGLLPVGIVDVEGHFDQQEAVRIVVVERQPMGSLPHFNESSTDTHSESSPINSIAASRAQSSLSSSSTLYSRGEEIARAVVNLNAEQINLVKGLRSADIKSILGYADSDYIAERENVSLIGQSRPQTPRPRSYIGEKGAEDTAVSHMNGSGVLDHVMGYVGGKVTPVGLERTGGSNGGTPDSSVGDLRAGR